MDPSRPPKQAWVESTPCNGPDNKSAWYQQLPHGANTIYGTTGTSFSGMQIPTGSVAQYSNQNDGDRNESYKPVTGSQMRGNTVGVHCQSASGCEGLVDTPQDTEGATIWYDQGQVEDKSNIPLSRLGDLSKLIELFKDKKTFIKLPREELHKKIAAIDVKTVLSAITNVTAMEKEIVKLHQELDSKIKRIECLERNHQSPSSKLAESNKKVAELEKRVDEKQKEIYKCDQKYKLADEFYGKEIKRLTNEITENQKQLHDADKERKRLDNELKETKLRLSRLIGNKLTDGNAEIADLSDENRPTKIGEKYLELYDNQWTDAFEVLQKYCPDDRSTIAHLLDILISVKLHCDGMSTTMTRGLVAAITITDGMGNAKTSDMTIPTPVNKQLKDLKKMSAGVSVTKVFGLFMDKARTMWPVSNMLHKALQEPAVKAYIKECTTLCWLMCVQDPPLVLNWDMKQSDEFNSNALKVYLQAGPVLEFLVWPPLYLKADGSLLAKGIAQGMQKQASQKQQVQAPPSTVSPKTAHRPNTTPAAKTPEQAKGKQDQARMKMSSRQNKNVW